MNIKLGLSLAAAGIVAVATAATAQVAYQPYAPAAPTPYGYPVPSGYLQPDEVLGTSPSFVISTNPYQPGVGVIQRCQYPNGWNVTDLSRDMNGIPNGFDHTCPAAVVAATPRRARVKYSRY